MERCGLEGQPPTRAGELLTVGCGRRLIAEREIGVAEECAAVVALLIDIHRYMVDAGALRALVRRGVPVERVANHLVQPTIAARVDVFTRSWLLDHDDWQSAAAHRWRSRCRRRSRRTGGNADVDLLVPPAFGGC